VVAKKDDYDPVTQAVDLQGGAGRTLKIALVRQVHSAHLVVVASEPNAIVAIDGTVVAQQRFEGSVSAGAHEVRVTAPGRVAYTNSIDIREREVRTLDVTLRSEAHGGPVWPWLVGGAVVVVGAAVGGYFLFRPHDQTTPVPDSSAGLPTLQLANLR
jgi:hypothetical protein